MGEFALGVNPYITRAMGDILFDEKISGSILPLLLYHAKPDKIKPLYFRLFGLSPLSSSSTKIPSPTVCRKNNGTSPSYTYTYRASRANR